MNSSEPGVGDGGNAERLTLGARREDRPWANAEEEDSFEGEGVRSGEEMAGCDRGDGEGRPFSSLDVVDIIEEEQPVGGRLWEAAG